MSGRQALVVVKVGGELLLNAEALDGIAADVAGLVEEGVGIVIAHGGGPQADALAAKLGYEVRKVGGRRVTDAGALEVAKMVYRGSANVELVAAIGKHGARAVGLSGVDGGIIVAVKRPPVAYVDSKSGVETRVDFGAVGDVREVNTELIGMLVGAGYVPVVASLCADAEGNLLNVNADTVARSLAVALWVERLVVLTNVPGIMRDAGDPGSRVAVCSLDEVRGMMADGTITGGMLPKVENCIRAIEAGVGEVQIVDGTALPSLLRGAVEGRRVGTLITGAWV